MRNEEKKKIVKTFNSTRSMENKFPVLEREVAEGEGGGRRGGARRRVVSADVTTRQRNARPDVRGTGERNV